MSTRANIIIQSGEEKLFFYRHSDGYPECAGKDLAEFVTGYADGGAMRTDVMQSAGWLIVRGHAEYLKGSVRIDTGYIDAPFTGAPRADDKSGMAWKVGAYEPTTQLHGDVEYIYIIDLEARTLTCRVPNKKYWDKPTMANTTASKKFKSVSFDPTPERTEEDVVKSMAAEVAHLFGPSNEGRKLAIDDAVARVLKAADIGPQRETRRDFDGVSESNWLAEKMIGEMLTTGRVNL